MRQCNKRIFTGISTGSSVNGEAINTARIFSASAQALVTTGGTGTLKMQASDEADNVTPSIWTDIPSATVSLSATGSFLLPKVDLCYGWIRLVFTTGTAGGTVTVNLQMLGS